MPKKFLVVIERKQKRGAKHKFDDFVRGDWTEEKDAVAWADTNCRKPDAQGRETDVVRYMVVKVVRSTSRVEPETPSVAWVEEG